MNRKLDSGTLKSRRDILWLPPLLLAIAFAIYIYFVMPHERELNSLWSLLFKLIPFFLASLSVAWFPPKIPTLPKVILVFATLLPFLGFLVPRELHLAIVGYEMDPTENPAALIATFGEFYTTMAILVPYVILMLAFAYRSGGGSAANSLKISWTGLLLMLSGYEDVMFWAVNARGPFPEVASWAHHVTVFLGRPATRAEFYGFIAVHVILIVVVFALPLDRIGEKLERRFFSPHHE